jgi:DNA modification methylase
MSKIGFCNEDCFTTMERMEKVNFKNNIILTSPPYNTGRPSNSERSRNNNEGRYDIHIDDMTNDEYRNWCVNLFNSFDNILADNGVILWNVSYGADATVNTSGIGLMWNVISDIIDKTDFVVADRIVWKKKSALPNNVSPNKLTRITEDIYVFCRKNEYKTFQCNKTVSSIGKNGQTFYNNVFNFIEAKNNDGTCKLNKATFSSDLCKQLLTLYGHEHDIVYDPFMGTGTTAIACEELNMDCYGSELSTEQVKYSKKD